MKSLWLIWGLIFLWSGRVAEGERDLRKCTSRSDPICKEACNEQEAFSYSATFCDVNSGNCVCDCRDKLRDSCIYDTESPCFRFCVQMNPNPNVFLYIGGQCETLSFPSQNVCACSCSARDDYEETNDVY